MLAVALRISRSKRGLDLLEVLSTVGVIIQTKFECVMEKPTVVITLRERVCNWLETS